MPRLLLGLLIPVGLGIAPVAGFAQAPTLSGGRDVFAISDCTAPVPLRFIDPAKPIAVRTGDIAPRPAANPPGWTIDWDKPQPTDPAIHEYASTGRFKDGCPAPGLFTIPLTIFGEDNATAPLSINLIRAPEPALDIPAAFTLAAKRHNVFGPPAPVPLLIRESVAGAPDTRVAVLGGELKTTAGEGTGIALEPSGPVVVKSGESARIMLSPTQTPAPGTYTTRLLVSSPAVKPGTVIDLTYKVRVTSAVLLALLALGVALGWWLNVYLAGRVALDAALQGGLRAMQALSRRAAQQPDPAVEQRLLAVAHMLQSSLEEASAPDEVNARVAEAEARAKEIESKAAEAAAALLQSLATTSAPFRPKGGALDPMLAARLADPLRDLDALQRAAEAGEVEQTTAKLQDYCRDLPDRVPPLLQAFLVDIRTDLETMATLPSDNGLEATRAALSQQIGDAYGSADLGAMVKAADEIARKLRAWMDLVAPTALATLWRQAAQILAAKPALAQSLSFAADQVEQLRRSVSDPLARLGAMADRCKSVRAAISEAAENQGAAVEALARGDVIGAARALAGIPRMTIAAAALLPQTLPAPDRALTVQPSGPMAVLRVKPLIPLNQDSVVVLRWMIDPPAPDRVAWRADPADAATLQATATGALVRPAKAGFLNILLEVDGARVATQTYAGEVAEQDVYTVTARQGRFARAGITIVTALLTGFAGYEIFAPTWFGTVNDCFAAFLWGFFGQFGLDRIRDLAKPLLGRTLPANAP